ncbi:MAG: hypothetical protein LQ346_008919 [Caloplaca aetnensis]|nr:MAG: hypothetical protein LQ346_008919 [Caloplaca aetnensis]
MRDMSLGKETVDHLELMHYYTSSTYLTISDSIEFQHIWQDIVPKEALSHTFLMHGILALAALHIAYDRPDEEDRYVLAALKHYDISIGSFRTMLQQVTADNCSALFAFSTILLVITLAFAQTHSHAEHGNPVVDLIQVFTLLQGTQAVLRSALQWIALGPLGPLVRRGLSGSKQVAPPKSDDTLTFERTLDQLQAHNERIAENVESRELYDRTIQRLRGCVKRIATYPGDRAAVMGWLVFLESSYVSALERGEPMALVIFAHYGVILHTLRQDWFVRDLGAQVVEMVHLQADDVWMPMLYWPMQQVGLRAEGLDTNQRASSN